MQKSAATARRSRMATVSIITFIALGVAGAAAAQTPADLPCSAPPRAHCAESCTADLIAAQGDVIEPKSGRAFFLDFPCDLKPGEKVLFVLNLHGAGSIGNWQRHYFPAVDYVDRYRLVVATPTAAGSGAIGARPVRMWVDSVDDAYLQAVASFVIERFGRDNIRAFWLAGHSQGGLTSNRIVCSAFFRDKVDGWLSLSGGRIGAAEIAPDFFGPNGPPVSADPNVPRPGVGVLPDCDISYIFESGEHEIVALPETSPIAAKYNCAARERRADVVDERKGYVTGAAPGRGASWGLEARPGTAQVFVYPECNGGRVMADVLRLDKGHTEGLEPRVTETLVGFMAGAPGGKLASRR